MIVPLTTENNLYPRGYKMFKQANRTMILLVKTRTDEKFSIVPEEGWFGQPKYSAPSKIILRCVGFCFCILHFICKAD